MKHKWLYATAMATAVIVAPVAADASIKGVTPGSEMETAVQSLVDRGVLSLQADKSFKANELLTRGEVAAVIAKSLQLDTTNVKDPGFKDVTKKDPNYKYIAAIAQAKIMNGSNGKFNPKNKVTRGQIAKILTEGFKLDLSRNIYLPFTDVKNEQTADYVKTLLAYNITTGISADRFGVNDNVKRGQLAVFIHRVEQHLARGSFDKTVTGSEIKLYASQFDRGELRAQDVPYFNDGVIQVQLGDNGSVTFKPLKEGTAKITVSAFSMDIDGERYEDYQFDVKKINGELRITMTHLKEPLIYPAYIGGENYKAIELFDLKGNKFEADSFIENVEGVNYLNVVAPAGVYKAKLTTNDNKIVDTAFAIYQDRPSAAANEVVLVDGNEFIIPMASGITDIEHMTYEGSISVKYLKDAIQVTLKGVNEVSFSYMYNGNQQFVAGTIEETENGLAIPKFIFDMFAAGSLY